MTFTRFSVFALALFSCSYCQVSKDCRVLAELESGGAGRAAEDRVVVSGDDQGEVERAVDEIERMVEHCQQSVCVRTLPAQVCTSTSCR